MQTDIESLEATIDDLVLNIDDEETSLSGYDIATINNNVNTYNNTQTTLNSLNTVLRKQQGTVNAKQEKLITFPNMNTIQTANTVYLIFSCKMQSKLRIQLKRIDKY